MNVTGRASNEARETWEQERDCLIQLCIMNNLTLYRTTILKYELLMYAKKTERMIREELSIALSTVNHVTTWIGLNLFRSNDDINRRWFSIIKLKSWIRFTSRIHIWNNVRAIGYYLYMHLICLFLITFLFTHNDLIKMISTLYIN